jgi:hypothetical protein
MQLRSLGPNVISHDATLIISELAQAGGKIDIDRLRRQCEARLTGCWAVSWDYLLDNDLVELANNEARSVASKLHSVVVYEVSPNPKNLDLKSVASSRSSTTLRSYAGEVDPEMTRRFAASVSKHCNSAYRAVVDGKRPRRTPFQTFVETMTPIDTAEFWEEFLKLDETAQATYRCRISRLAAGSRRDRAPPASR